MAKLEKQMQQEALTLVAGWCVAKYYGVGRKKPPSLRPTTPPPNIHVVCRGIVLDMLLEKEKLWFGNDL